MRSSLATSLLAMLVLLAPPLTASGDAGMLSGAALVDALRRGGFNIYFRHAQTDWSQDDHVERAGDWSSCDPDRIRQLSAQGRATARAIGDAMRALRVPVGRVLASPYCRTVQTAELMGYGRPEPTEDVINLRVADEHFGGRDAVVARARALLATSPVTGTNTIIAAHGNVAQAATPVYPQEAEGVVVKPLGDDAFEVVARVTPEEWIRLREAHAAAR